MALVRPHRFYVIGHYLCLDFINTEAAAEGRPVNLLAGFDDLMAWLVETGALERRQAEGVFAAWNGRPEAERALSQALRFRAILRRMVEKLTAGKPAPTAAVAAINDCLRNQVRYTELGRTAGGFVKRIRSNITEPEHLLLPVAESACDLLCDGDFSRIKQCGNEACVLFFYDCTKNRSRRWCSMSACGNRMKVAAHYRSRRGRATRM
jgi:predicted RNA-binding Zn ribbon-like protein